MHSRLNAKFSALFHKLTAAARGRRANKKAPVLQEKKQDVEVVSEVIDTVVDPVQQQDLEWVALSEEIRASNLPPLHEKLSGYVLKRPLGSGGYGTVYLAEQPTDASRVAIKVVKKSRLVEKKLGGAAEMKNEMNILSALTKASGNSSMFTKLHDAFQDGHNYYFVMDFVSGGSLADELENGSMVFSEQRSQFYMAQLFLGVAFMHSQGIIHRDLKPDNCLFTANGLLTIADFGLAFNLSDGAPSNYCGTPGYTAPEVYLQLKYSFPVDSWALGSILYEMLVGRVPFDNENPDHIRYLTLTDTIVFPPHRDVSAQAKDLIRSLMRKTPSIRLTAVNAMSHPFVGPDSYMKGNWASIMKQTMPAQPHWITRAAKMNFNSSLRRDVLLDRDIPCSEWIPTAGERAFSNRAIKSVASTIPPSSSAISEEWEIINDVVPAATRLPGASVANAVMLDISALPTCLEEAGDDDDAWAHCTMSPIQSEPQDTAGGIPYENSWEALFDESIELVQAFEPIPLPESCPAEQDVTECVRSSPRTLISPIWIPDSKPESETSPAYSEFTLFNRSACPSSAAMTLVPSLPGFSQEVPQSATAKSMIILPPKGVRRMKAFVELPRLDGLTASPSISV